MNLQITMPTADSTQASYELKALADFIETEGDISVDRTTAPSPPGTKDPFIVTAIAVAGLGFSAIATVISVLQYWQSQRPKYSITVTRGDVQIQLADIKPKQLNDALAQLETAAQSPAILIEIAPDEM